MEIVVAAFITIGLAATAGALLAGLISMGRGGEFDKLHSHELMFARVGLQAITLVCLLIALLVLL